MDTPAVGGLFRNVTRAAKPIVLFLLVALVVAGVAGWSLRNRGFKAQSIPLGGGQLTLASVQGGHFHANPFDTPWKLWFARIPPAWISRLKISFPKAIQNSGGSDTNAFLTCWFTWNTNFSAAGAMPGNSALGIHVADDEGNVFGSVQGAGANGTTRANNPWEAHRLNIVPRRSEWLRILVSDSPWSGKSLGEFRVRNPLWDRDSAPFAGNAIPTTSASDDLEATLERFTVVTNRILPQYGKHTARLEFTLRQRGQTTTNWVAYHVASVRDATGNAGDGNSWNHGWDNQRAFVQFSQYPLPHDEPWSMDIEFCQRGGFPTNEVWELKGLQIARAYDGSYPSQSRTNHGSRITLSPVVPDPNGRDFGSGNTNTPVRVLAKLSVDKAPDARRWHTTIVSATDDLGKDVTSNAWSGGDDTREFGFELSPGARSIDLKIAYAPSRMIHFVAKPVPIPAKR